MGSSIGIVNTQICKGFFGSAFGSVRTRNRLVWLHVWHYILRYKAYFFQIHFCWWRRIYSLSLTPFSETYELRGYVVEGYQRYTPNLVMWHAECCCVLMIICWSKHGFVKKRSFVDETSSNLTNRKWSKQERCGKVMRVAPFRVPSGKRWYYGMEPRYLPVWLLQSHLLCVIVALWSRRLG